MDAADPLGVLGVVNPIENFSKMSAVKNLTVGELQRLNVANEVKLGLKNASEAAKPLAEGGASISGNVVKGGGKIVELKSIGNGEYQVDVKTLENNKVTSTITTTGNAEQLGVKNLDELTKKGVGFNNHYLQEKQ